MAQKLPAEDRQEFYVNMKSGAESGWDFSSRWFVANDSSNLGNLFDTRVRYILPVDLNAFLCMNARLLSQLFTVLEDHDKAEIYRQKYEQLKEAIKQVHILQVSTVFHRQLTELIYLSKRYFGMRNKALGLITIC